MAQTWNNLLSYIKLELGAPLNLLEMSDQEIIENIKEHILPFFSQYMPRMKFCIVNEADLARIGTPGEPRYKYKIPREVGEPIYDIKEVYFASDSIVTDDLSLMMTSYSGAIDTLLMNTYLDEMHSLQVRQTWEFFPPDIIVFDEDFSSGGLSAGAYAVVHYGTLHTDLDTIDPDAYNLAFRKLVAGQIKLWIAAMRSKYENLATPFGQINVNYQALQESGQRNIEEATQWLQNIPPDKLLELGF